MAAAATATFSPLTMFECTISSATMLIDNMAVRDLLVAFKIVAQLHGHLLEVLDPTVLRLVSLADEHALCPPPPPAFADPSGGGTGGSGGHLSARPGPSGDAKLGKSEPSAGAGTASVKSEFVDSDDDCVLMETDLIFEQSMSSSLSSTVAKGSPAAGGGGGDLSNEWKGTLRRAYRVLKEETGSNVFDFALPYSARVNVQAANRVIDKALVLGKQKPPNVDVWRTTSDKYLRSWYSQNLRRDYNTKARQSKLTSLINLQSKLNRRQKSYEAMKPELDQGTRARYEAVLTRDYTSSDEESGGADLDSEARVRCLAWESAELQAIKQRLDAVFAERLADERQRGEMARLLRHPGHLSGRPPPPDCVPWARDPGYVAADDLLPPPGPQQ